jgi:hypothetical protein
MMMKTSSEIWKCGLTLMPLGLSVLAMVGLAAAARPAPAQVQWNHDTPPPLCGMVTTPTGDEFWPCPLGQNNTKQPPPLPDVWGAVAVSPSTLLWGASWNFKSREGAAADALKRCLASGNGATDCKVVLKVADVCTALVVSAPEKIYQIGGPTGATNFASDNGILKCQRARGKSCRAVISFCADGVNHVLKGTTVFSNGNPIFVPEGQTAAPGRR